MPDTNLFRFLTDEAKRSRLVSLREAVTPILANNLQTEFTDHSRDHSDAVASLVDQLIGPLQSGQNTLSQRELFVLYAACYLHDIGMQYENAGRTRTVVEAGLEAVWASLSKEDRAAHLRRLHPPLAAEMVILSVRSSAPPIGLALTDEDDSQLIAPLCEAHGLDVEDPKYQVLANLPGVRMHLLSGLLRMADILEESSRRAKRRKAQTLLLPLESQAHWWRHYYTREVLFDPDLKSIALIFDFPVARRQEYADIIPSLNVSHIQAELRCHALPFARYGVPWVIKSLIDDNPYGVAEDMPVDVLLTMTSWLRKDAEREAELRRKAVDFIYERVQPAVKHLIDEVEQLPPETPLMTKVAKFEAVADHFKQLEAYRSEAAYVEQAYRASEQAGNPELQLRLGLRLLPLRGRSGNEAREQHLLMDCERIADAALATPEQRLEIAVLKAQALGSLCVHLDLLTGYRQSVNEATRSASKLGKTQVSDSLNAELAEVEWLLGDSEAAEATLTLISPLETELQDSGNEPHPLVHAAIVRAHLAAGRGDLAAAAALLEQPATACAKGEQGMRSRLFLLNAQGHLYYLANRPADALRFMSAALEEPALRDHRDFRRVLDQNHLLCRLAASAPDAFRLHNELRDAGRLIEDAERDKNLLRALNDQRAGKYDDALPAFWRELCQAYRSGGWERYRDAEEYYATQCFLLGWLEASARHAVRGCATDLLGNIAKVLLAKRAGGLVQAILLWITKERLTRHYVVACKFLLLIADAVNDEHLGPLTDFLLSEAASLEALLNETATARPAWDALFALAPVLKREQAEQLLNAVEQVDLACVSPFLVEKIVTVLDQIVPVLSELDIDRTMRLLLPLSEGFPQTSDHQIYYPAVLDALANLWRHLDVPQAKTLADKLFPPGGTTNDILKLTMLPAFNKFNDCDANRMMINSFAQNAAALLRLQVQRFAPTDLAEPQTVTWSLGTMAYQDEGGRRVVSMGGGLKDLEAAVAYAQHLEPQTLQLLLQSCLDMATDPQNIISNRTSILQAVQQMGPSLSEEQRKLVRKSVLPLARGTLIGDFNQNLHDNSLNPLNRFKINLGNPGDLQGAALYCLCWVELVATQPQFHWIWSLLEEVIVSADAPVRRHATVAVSILPEINPSVFMALLCNLRDPDADTSAYSYWALATKEHLFLDNFTAGLLLTSIRGAAQHASAAVRAGAAALVKRIEPWLPDTEFLRQEQVAVQQIFDADICRSVRQSAYFRAETNE